MHPEKNPQFSPTVLDPNFSLLLTAIESDIGAPRSAPVNSINKSIGLLLRKFLGIYLLLRNTVQTPPPPQGGGLAQESCARISIFLELSAAFSTENSSNFRAGFAGH